MKSVGGIKFGKWGETEKRIWDMVHRKYKFPVTEIQIRNLH